jgi:3-methyladenine DNA glycosylase/8-oxoguanine DNA glycosylase
VAPLEGIRAGLAFLREADPVLAQLIDDRPHFDPDVSIRRLPAMDLFGALVFQVIGQQISVIAAPAISGQSDRDGTGQRTTSFGNVESTIQLS